MLMRQRAQISLRKGWPLVGLMLCLFTACEDETASTALRHCANDGVGCPEGLVCQQDIRGVFYCGPDGNGGSGGGGIPVLDMGGSQAQGGAGGTAGSAGSGGMAGNAGNTGSGGSGGAGGMAGSAGQGDAGGTGGAGGNCGTLRLLLKPTIRAVARVMVVVDRSYSMIEDQDRWTPMINALSTVAENLEGGVQFGLVLFPDPFPPGNVDPQLRESCAPGRVNLMPGPGQAAELYGILENSEPRFNQGTPTNSALLAAGEALRQNPSDNDYILLATDGGPGCNFELDHTTCVCLTGGTCVVWERPQNCLDDRRTIDTVAQLADEGIRTMVLGITDDDFIPEARQVLDQMAVAGNTAVDGRHFEVADLDDLQQSIVAAAGSLAPCSYDLQALAEEADRLEVVVDGQPVPRDRNRVRGWDVVDGALEFFGESCQALRDGRAHQVVASCQ